MATVFTGASTVHTDHPFNFAKIIIIPLLFGLDADGGIFIVHRLRNMSSKKGLINPEITGSVLTEAQKQSVRIDLITADYAIRAANQGVATGDQIAGYHKDVFIPLGIPAEAWTATALQDIFGPPAWCFDCSPEVVY